MSEQPARLILAVDDEESSLKLIRLLLERVGYRVLTAPSGEEGLVLAKAEQPDVILLDVIMPGIDGHEMLRRLKRDPDTKAIPVMMVTARGADQDIEQSFKLGAVFHLEKPYETHDLLKKLEVTFALHPDRPAEGGNSL